MSRAQRGREEPEAKALDAEQGGDSLSAAGSPPGPGAGKPGEQPLPQTLQVAVAPACASYGRSHLTRPLSCVTQPVSGGGGALRPPLCISRGRGHSRTARARTVSRGLGLSKPRVSSAGSTGRQPVRTDSHALRGLATVLPAARTDACHRRGRPDVTIHHRIPLLPPGAWEAGKPPGFTQKGSGSARKKKIKTGALPPPRLTMRT